METVKITKRKNRKLYIGKGAGFFAGDISCGHVVEIFAEGKEIEYKTDIKEATFSKLILNGCIQLLNNGHSIERKLLLNMAKGLVNNG